MFPPLNAVTHGRMNSLNEPMLYLSDRKDTALTEISDSKNSVSAHFIGLAPKEEKDSFFTLVGEIFDIYRRGAGDIIYGDTAKTVNSMINGCNRDEAARLIISDRILLELLCSNKTYVDTSFVAKLLRDKSPNADGILYPSVRQYGGRNVALRPESLDKWCVKSVFSATESKNLGFGLWDHKGIAHLAVVSDAGDLQYGECHQDEGAIHILKQPIEIVLGVHTHPI